MGKYILSSINSERFGIIEISEYNSDMLIYRMPYQTLKQKENIIDNLNNFIVYILYGRNDNGKDYVYVGKSKNGIKDRPTSHEKKYKNWEACYILTNMKERTFFNDGTIQYIEDKIKHRLDDVGKFINVTEQTTSGTVNQNEESICDDYIEKAYKMLYVLGLDLRVIFEEQNIENESKHKEETENNSVVPSKNAFDRKYKYCMLQSFSFKGQKYYKNSFREMLCKMMEILYSEKKNEVENLAKTKYRIKKAKKRIYISYDINDFKNECTELNNTKIFFLVNLSQDNIMNFIKDLLVTLDYDLSEFTIEAY